jgi:hypothetical protein
MSNQDGSAYKIISGNIQDLPDKYVLNNTEYAKSDVSKVILNNNFQEDVTINTSIIDWKDNSYSIVELRSDTKITGTVTYKNGNININLYEVNKKKNTYMIFYLDKLSKIDVTFSRLEKETFFQKHKKIITVISIFIFILFLAMTTSFTSRRNPDSIRVQSGRNSTTQGSSQDYQPIVYGY